MHLVAVRGGALITYEYVMYVKAYNVEIEWQSGGLTIVCVCGCSGDFFTFLPSTKRKQNDRNDNTATCNFRGGALMT